VFSFLSSKYTVNCSFVYLVPYLCKLLYCFLFTCCPNLLKLFELFSLYIDNVFDDDNIENACDYKNLVVFYKMENDISFSLSPTSYEYSKHEQFNRHLDTYAF